MLGQSPYCRFLDHEALTDITSEDVRLLVFFVAGWTLMIFAMMLPTTLPLLTLFRNMTSDRWSVMAIEKNMPWGRKLSTPLGLALIGWGFITVVLHL